MKNKNLRLKVVMVIVLMGLFGTKVTLAETYDECMAKPHANSGYCSREANGVPSATGATSAGSNTSTAPSDYTVLQPLPGITPDNCVGTACKTNLSKYLPAAFNLAIGIAAGMAFVMITLGGFWYATADSLGGKEEGKKYITDAIYGLLLVIGAWIILNTINPQILTFNLSLQKPNIQASASSVTVASCPTCQTLASSNIPTSGSAVGKSIAPQTATELGNLNDQLSKANIGWNVTEGYPPSIAHADPCHSNGTCVDAVLTNPSSDRINATASLAKNVGLTAWYEVSTTARMNDLINAGVNPSIIRVIPYATGDHFHIQ